ncbi:hypothetical protein BS78_09G183400 [Paspalum vaginatum]|nr:hypothetical protein BS78_09G183400 [Paspalum vaginatum]
MPDAVIFFCSKCRTPIRGKNPVPTEDIDQALSRLEILSVDAASVFSDEPDACHNKLALGVDIDGDQPPFFQQDVAPAPSSSPAPPGGFSSARRGHFLNNGAFKSSLCEDGFVDSNDQEKLRPSSRRTRRPSSSDSNVLRYGVLMPMDSEAEELLSSPRNASERRRRRRSLRGSQEFDTSIGLLSRQGAAPSPLRDPAFNVELLHALDSLRGLIAAMEPTSSGSGGAGARRDAHLFRRLESRLARALRTEVRGGHHRTCASSIGSSPSSSCGYNRGERQKSHCRPVLGAAPFLVCGGCSELLQAPATTALSCGKVARLRCGGCKEVLRLTVPAGAGGSAPHKTTRAVSPPPRSDPASSSSSGCGDSAQPLHRALGYSSPSPLLQSRRY